MNAQEFQNDKLHIINWITQLQDYSLIEKIKSLMPTTDISDEQKAAIDKALDSVEKNGTLDHNDVMAETKKRYPHLFK